MTAKNQQASKTATKSRRGVQSISVGLSLLEALAAAKGPMHLRDLANAAKMTPQKAHRYLLSLVAAELAEQDPVSGRYDLGSMSMRLGIAGLARRNELQLITRAAQEFGHSEDVTIAVAVWGSHGPTFIAWQDSSLAPLCNFGAGSVMQLLRSATGRVFLAFMPTAILRPFIDHELAIIASYAPNAQLRTWEDVESLIRRVRMSRVGTTHEDLIPGLSAVAVPVFDHQGQLKAVIMQMGLSGQIHSETLPASQKLLSLADSLSMRLGFNPQEPKAVEILKP